MAKCNVKLLIQFQARSSVVEHHLDMVVVGGSIPLAPTKKIRVSTKSGGGSPPNPGALQFTNIVL